MVVARDYGREGSSTCGRNKCRSQAWELNIDHRLERLGVVVAEYEPAANAGSGQSGFASVVEKELLARGDYLITVGWGSYQTSVVERFITVHEHVDHAKAANSKEKNVLNICKTK